MYIFLQILTNVRFGKINEKVKTTARIQWTVNSTTPIPDFTALVYVTIQFNDCYDTGYVVIRKNLSDNVIRSSLYIRYLLLTIFVSIFYSSRFNATRNATQIRLVMICNSLFHLFKVGFKLPSSWWRKCLSTPLRHLLNLNFWWQKKVYLLHQNTC